MTLDEAGKTVAEPGTPAPKRAGRGPYRNGRRTREQIVAEAITAIAERGFHGASLRSIAAAVGISPAALLRHFESKDELLAAVLKSWAVLTDDLQGSYLRGLQRWKAQPGVMAYHINNRGLLEFFITLAAEATSADHPAREYMAPRYTTAVNLFADSLLEAAEDGEIASITPAEAQIEARALLSFMDGIEIQWLLDPSIDMVGEVDIFVAHTLERLRTRRQS
ncbi:MAG: TetR/AcrR family transcriptional regulator [Propionibacteriaceae bacterium]|jgi:AcrR family transcriptional regulator|nr:TetR/AcrR family transcriptional regulator [Propionibacteriaceae bacterium]